MRLFRRHGQSIKALCDIGLHFLFPVSCEKCGRLGVKLCVQCRDTLALHVPSRRLPKLFTKIITREIDGMTVYSASEFYVGSMRTIIHNFKYKGHRELGRPLGKYMAELFGECKADCLVPVPLHLKSERSFNQARELAEGMGEHWGIEVLNAARWTRVVPRRASSGVRGDLSVRDFRLTRLVEGKRIALVDDVCTSGNTLRCFAERCRREGAEVICAYTLATV